jgi:multiple antibiotic resistance protein
MYDLIIPALIFQLFVLINPLSSLSVLIAAHKNKLDIKKIAYNAVAIAFILAVIIALLGPFIFKVFGVTIDSFRIAGGLVLLLLGIRTVSSNKEKYSGTKVDSLISIVATPLLTGPATISFITIKAYELNRTSLLMNILITFLFVGLTFIIFAHSLNKINMKIVDITSRVLGLFLTAMAIEMILHGIVNVVQSLV